MAGKPIIMLLDGKEVEVLGPDEDALGYVFVRYLTGPQHEARVPYSWLQRRED